MALAGHVILFLYHFIGLIYHSNFTDMHSQQLNDLKLKSFEQGLMFAYRGHNCFYRYVDSVRALQVCILIGKQYTWIHYANVIHFDSSKIHVSRTIESRVKVGSKYSFDMSFNVSDIL